MMNSSSPRALNGKDSIGSSSSKNTLLGLVRRVSRGGKLRDKGNRATIDTQESAYRKVTPNVAPSSLYPSTNLKAHQEILVWGRPPALSSESRTIEGVELVDDGPSQRPGSSHPLRVVQRNTSKTRERPRIEEEKPELSPRRSIDSLFSSMNAFVPTLPHQSLTSAKAANGPRRAVSVRVNGPKTAQLGRASSISSTPRAKPAQDLLASPPRQNSPLQRSSSSSTERSLSNGVNSGLLDQAEEQRLREAFAGKGAVWAVARGWKRGIVATFEEAEQQTRSFPGPVLRQFDSVDEAIDFLKTPSHTTRPNGEDKGSMGVHFEDANLQRQLSHQRQSSPPTEHLERAASIRRTIRSPATNPFLSDLDRKMPGRSFSTGSPAKPGQLTGSPSLLSQRPPISRDSSANNFLLPPAVLSAGHSETFKAPSASVTATPIIMCQDLDLCISFYQSVLGFLILIDDRQKGRVSLRHNSTQAACLTLRSRITSSSAPVMASSPSRIPYSMYRSSVLLDVGHRDMHQLHTDVTSLLVSFQSEGKDLIARVEGIEGKPWGSTEFMVFDPEGNMIVLAGSSSPPV